MLLKYLSIIVFLMSSAAYANEPCTPKEDALTNPTTEQTGKCLRFIWSTLSRRSTVDTKFTNRFVDTLLPASQEQQKKLAQLGEFDIDYMKLVEIISLLGSSELIKSYLDFIVFSAGSADELRSFGLGRLYSLEAPKVLNLLSSYKLNEQGMIINSLSWGLANNYYPIINKENYKRLIVGEYWELANSNHPQRNLSQKVEAGVLVVIKGSSNNRL